MAISRVGSAATVATFSGTQSHVSGTAVLQRLSNGNYAAVVDLGDYSQATPILTLSSFVFNSSGAVGNAPITIQSGDLDFISTHIAATANGGYTVAFQSKPGSTGAPLESDVFTQTFSSTNTTASGLIETSNTDEGEGTSSIVRLSNGNQLILWIDSHGTPSDNTLDFDVYGRIYDGAGAPVGAEFKVNASASAANIEFGTNAAQLSDDRILATWSTNTLIPGPTGPTGFTAVALTGRFLTAAGAPTGSDITLRTFPTGFSLEESAGILQDILPDGSGGFWMTWVETNRDVAPQTSISSYAYLQHFSSSGTAVGSLITVDSSVNQDFTATPIPATAFIFDDLKLMTLPGGKVGVYAQIEQPNNFNKSGIAVYGDTGTVIQQLTSIENLSGNQPMGDVIAVEADANGMITALTSRHQLINNVQTEVLEAVQLSISGVSISPPPSFYDWRLQFDLRNEAEPFSNTQIATINRDGTHTVLNGSFVIDPNLGPMSGPVSSMQLTDADGTVRTTVSGNIPTIEGFNVAMDVIRNLSDQISWSSGEGMSLDGALLLATPIRMEFSNLDGTRTVMLGTGLSVLSDGGSSPLFSGNVQTIQHVASNGTTVLQQVTGLNNTLAQAWAATYDDMPYLYDVWFAGANTFTSGFAAGGSPGMITGGAGNDTIIGGAGYEVVNYNTATSAVNVNLMTGVVSGGGGADVLQGPIDAINGSYFDDVLRGNALDNVIKSRLGADQLFGEGGADELSGKEGNDTLDGGSGADSLFGNEGNDVIFYDADDVLASVLGGTDTDTLVFTSGAAPTSFNLTAHEFEKAEGRFTDTGANAWTSYVNNYDSQWRLTHQTGLMDSGQTYFEDYDELGTETWVRITYWNDALARPDVETGQLDDGRFYDSDHDNGNLYSWSRIDYWRDALARSDVETGFLDDGRTYNSDLDNGDAFAWLRIDNWADSLGRLDYQNGFYDADDATRPGWSWQVDYDQADQFTWTRVERFWNAAGVLQSETFF